MISYANTLLQRSRTLVQRFFLLFGLHCATHQIRIILVSCVVITSLFYPALAIYSSSRWSLIHAFLTPTTTSDVRVQNDLVDLWSHHDTLRLHDDPVSRAKCGAGHALRVERILIHSPAGEDNDNGVLTHQTLLSALNLENRLEKLILAQDTPCIRRPDGKCFVLSPLLFWDYDKEKLHSDTNILNTLSIDKNISLGGITITPQMVLAGRGSNGPHVAGSKYDSAVFLALTYFFPQLDCLGTSAHASWLETVQQGLDQNLELTYHIEEPPLIAIEYNPNSSGNEGWSALSAFLYVAYIGFFAYVAWSVGKMSAVHSRLGVTFTALVEIAVSTITSLSVCALVGFKVTMVPWELLPIVIIFVGAENMFNLVDAVGKTSVTLSVKQRIAEGLSRAGTSNTLKVVLYNSILGVIAVFSAGAIRQFCSFAIVVLVAHWFLAHTFFMAVLSIDIQRLELEELLQHDSSTLAPAKHVPKDNNDKRPQSGWQKLALNVKNILRSRATTNLSLLILLAITATLYYTTYTTSTHDQAPTALNFGAVSRIRNNLTDTGAKPTAWHIWKTLNPAQAPLLHLRTELPAIITFRPNFDGKDQIKRQKLFRSHFSIFRSILWLLKIMVLPIGVTTGALWGLLLYLLKDAELLEAQRNRAEPSGVESGDKKPLEDHISFSTLPRTFSSDVELIAASKDGKTVISVGLHNEIAIWWVNTGAKVSIDAAELLLRGASTSFAASTLTKVAIDPMGTYCAVGTGAGIIAVWALEGGKVLRLPQLSVANLSAGITDLQFAASSLVSSDRTSISSENNSSTRVAVAPILLATYENGMAIKWTIEDTSIPTYFTHSRQASVIKSTLVRVHPLDRFLVAFSLDDGTLELIEAQNVHQPIQHDYRIQAGSPVDMASRVHACEADLGGSTRIVIVVTTEEGTVSIWDGLTGECVFIFEESYGRINNLRISSVHCNTCHFCGQLPLESLAIAFSVDHMVRLFKLYLNDQTRRCSCSSHQLRHVSSRDSIGHRSRSNSTTTQVGSVSPSIPRARLTTTFETSAFPVSGHGVHSKRASEKDPGRRSLDALTVPFSGEEYDDASGVRTPSNSSFWRDAVLVRVVDIACERGAWDVNDRKFFGVRRKPRVQGRAPGGSTVLNTTQSQGLTTATLERWEFWTFDPSSSRLQSALLTGLTKKLSTPSCPPPLLTSTPASTDSVPRLPFTRVSSLLTTPSHALAGFGNTVGIFKFSGL